jgi:hypothetical protein
MLGFPNVLLQALPAVKVIPDESGIVVVLHDNVIQNGHLLSPPFIRYGIIEGAIRTPAPIPATCANLLAVQKPGKVIEYQLDPLRHRYPQRP